MKTCFFTGHRKIALKKLDQVINLTNEAVIYCISQGCVNFKVGGARGFDTIAAFCVVKLRRSFPFIRLIMVLPCPEQSQGWEPADVELYEYFKSVADEVFYVAESYDCDCMRRRNQELVNGSDFGICYYSGSSRSGTRQTLSMAAETDIKLINVYLKG